MSERRAMIAAGLLLLAGCRAAPKPAERVSLLQEQHDSDYVCKFIGSEECREVAQTFAAPAGHLRLVEISIFVTATLGRTAYLQVFELKNAGAAPDAINSLATMKIDLTAAPAGKLTSVPVVPPLRIKPGKAYGFMISVDEHGCEIGVARQRRQDVFPSGKAWYFGPPAATGRSPAPQKFEWRSSDDDLAFRLTFEKQR